jgi:hypothetical protein
VKTACASVSQCDAGGAVQTPWRQKLHHDFERALAETKLPERPDYEAANGSSSKRGGKWRTPGDSR